jgi:hypothetical protein
MHSQLEWQPSLSAALGASRSGPACDATFREVPWTEDVWLRGAHREATGDGRRIAPALDNGAIRAWDPADKSLDLLDEDGQVFCLAYLPALG